MLAKSSVENKSGLNFNVKFLYVLLVIACMGLYFFVKKKLLSKINNSKIVTLYCYMFLAVIVFVSRAIMVYILNNNQSIIDLGYSNGFFSYINYGLGKLLNNNIYANIIINTIIVYISSLLIKKIFLNITTNDFVSTITAIIYIFVPKSLINVKEYIKYEYNILFILVGIYILVRIIDLVKDFKNKNNKYVIYSIILGITASLDILHGGSYIFWMLLLIFTTISTTYVDITHIKISDDIKRKLGNKNKKIIERIEKINISKLVYVCFITLSISLVFTIINSLITGVNNYEMRSVINGISLNLQSSRNYYLAIIIFTVVFDMLGIILKRDIDVKMVIIKICYLSSLVLIPFVNTPLYSSFIFDTFLCIGAVISICNVCINREEKIKLLKEKN